MKAPGVSIVLFLLTALAAGGAEPRAEPQPWVTHPFNGKDLDGWKLQGWKDLKNLWRVGKAELDPDDPRRMVAKEGGTDLVNIGIGDDIKTEARYGDCRIEIEVLVPKMGNSGIYVMGRHEIQVLDGINAPTSPKGNMGAIYDFRGPAYFPAEWQSASWQDPKWKAWMKSDAYQECVRKVLKPPGEWQKFAIEFRLGGRDPATKTATPARFVRVELNGVTIHENVEFEKPENPGPLYLQGNHGPVAYRNITITPLEGGAKESNPGERKP
jgi:hypothetical protein